MEGIYGFDITTRTYWWKVEIMNQEVASGRGLTKKELEEVMEKHSMYTWYKDTDFLY